MDFKNELSRFWPFLANSAPAAWVQSLSRVPGQFTSPPLGVWLPSLMLQCSPQGQPEMVFCKQLKLPLPRLEHPWFPPHADYMRNLGLQ